MLVIRKEQKEILARLPRTLFEDRLIQHLNRFYTRECRELGQEQVRIVAQHSIKRAEEHDFRNQRQVAFYLSLMFKLGSNFDRDPQLPWAMSILADESVTDPSERMKKLWEAAMAYTNEITGEENEFLVQAMRRIRDYDLMSVPKSPYDEFEDDLCDLLNYFYPQKWGYQGVAATQEAIRWSIESANRYGLQTNESMCVFVILIFMLGIGFHHDPIFPWAGRILRDGTLDADTRSVQLYEEAVAYWEMTLTGE